MKSKQTITFFTRILPPNPGGVERHIENIAPYLSKLGYKVQLVGHDRSGIASTFQRLVIPSELEENKLLTWKWILDHRHEFGPILHSHDVHWWLLPLMFHLKTSNIFGTYHGYHSTKPPTIKETIVRKLLHTRLAGSINVGRWIDGWYGTKADDWIYGAADYKRASLPENHSACFIGRLEEDTALLEYLELAELIGPELPLQVYGQGALLSVVQRYQVRSPWIQYKGVAENPGQVLKWHSVVFAGQYLSIIEGLQSGRLVVSIPNCELKRQYLESFPGKEYLIYNSDLAFCRDQILLELSRSQARFKRDRNAGVTWASKQQWIKIADQYHELWTTKGQDED